MERDVLKLVREFSSVQVGVDSAIVKRDVIGQQFNLTYQTLSPTIGKMSPSNKTLNSFFGGIITSLKKLYKTEETIMDPLPWEKQMRLYPEENVVNLDMQIMNRLGEFSPTQPCSQLSDLLDPRTSGGDDVPCHVLIRGEAGLGKSTICSKLAYDWAKNRQTFLKFPCDNTLLVLYRLKNLPPESDLEKELIRMIHSHSSESCGDISFTENALRNFEGKLLIILDGHDELRIGNENQVKMLLKARKNGPQSCLRHAVVILTSRLDMKNTMNALFDRLFLMNGMSYDNCKSFILKLCPENSDKLIRQLDMLKLEKLPPIAILMVCYLHKNSNLELLNNTEDLFLQVIFLMAKRCNDRDEFGLQEETIREKLLRLGKFFFARLMTNQVIIPDRDLFDFFQEDCRFILNSGVLKGSNTSCTCTSGQLYEPVHRLIMESLALWYLNKHWTTLTNVAERTKFFTEVGFSESVHLSVTFSQLPDQKVLVTLQVGSQESTDSHLLLNWNTSRQVGENSFTLFDLGVWSGVPDSRIGIYFKKWTQNSRSTATVIEMLNGALPDIPGMENLLPMLENLPQSVYRFRLRGHFRVSGGSESETRRDSSLRTLTYDKPVPQLETLYSLVYFLTNEKNTVRKILANKIQIALSVSILGCPNSRFIQEYLSKLLKMLSDNFQHYKVIVKLRRQNEDFLFTWTSRSDAELPKGPAIYRNIKAYDLYASFGFFR